MSEFDKAWKVKDYQAEIERLKNIADASVVSAENIRHRLSEAQAERETLVMRIKNLENEKHQTEQSLKQMKRFLEAEVNVSARLGKMVMDQLRQTCLREVGE